MGDMFGPLAQNSTALINKFAEAKDLVKLSSAYSSLVSIDIKGAEPEGITLIEKFKAWISARGIIVEETVLRTIVQSEALGSQLRMCRNADDAAHLYEKAAAVPRTQTRVSVRMVKGVTINGLLHVPGAQTANFFHAFLDNVPRVLKVPLKPGKAKAECALWEELSTVATPHIFLVPVTFLELSGTHAVHTPGGLSDVEPLRAGILMPSYVCTLFNVPSPLNVKYALSLVERMSAALDFIRDHGWLHGDVKPENMFVDFHGRVWLGDYGSSIRLDAVTSFTGGTPAYQCADIMAVNEPRRFDRVGLVITVLIKLDLLLLQHAPSVGWPFQSVSDAVDRVGDVSLKRALTDLLRV